MKKFVRKLFDRLGYEVVAKNKTANYPADLTAEEREICATVAPFTMTGIEAVVSLIRATKYLTENDIDGDIVECGVWRGGSAMAVAETLKRAGDTTRKIYLYDTFEGMTPPTQKDRQFDGKTAAELWAGENKSAPWCYAPKRKFPLT